ncbi:hypothetical protein Bca4012_065730 [Brassica carinata]
MLTNSHGSGSPHCYHFDAFRFAFVVNAIVALYSVFEMGSWVWENNVMEANKHQLHHKIKTSTRMGAKADFTIMMQASAP